MVWWVCLMAFPRNEYLNCLFCIHAGSRWRVKQLTYSITKYPSALKTADVDRELAKAFQVWEDVTELTFVHLKTGKVHIEIR